MNGTNGAMRREQAPPQDIDAEISVLGSIMLQGDGRQALDEAALLVRPGDFYRPAHRDIFATMLLARAAGEPPGDLRVLLARLTVAGIIDSVGGIEYVAGLTDAVPSAANAAHYAAIVRDHAARRAVLQAGYRLTSVASDPTADVPELLADAERALTDAAHRRETDAPEALGDVLGRVFGELQEVAAGTRRAMGLPTGFYELDDSTTGLHPGQLIIVAGRPGMGKSSLALRIAEHAALQEQAQVLVFSLEMGRDELALRIACGRAGISERDLRRGRASEADHQRLAQEAPALQAAPIRFDRSSHLTIGDLRARARAAHRAAPLGLVIVDYLQLVSAPGGNRQEEVAAVSRGLKALAIELDAPIIALSSLSRAVETRDDRRPRMSDLRESGAIEADADVILMLYREEYYHPNTKVGVAELIVAKQRSGPTGTIELAFRAACARFDNLSRTPDGGQDRRYPT